MNNYIPSILNDKDITIEHVENSLKVMTIVWSSVMRAFEKAVELQGKPVLRPKALGDIRDVSYIYPMLYRLGVIEASEEAAEKMEIQRPLPKKG